MCCYYTISALILPSLLSVNFCSQCVEIVVRVIELHARKWGRPTNSPSNPTTALNQFLFGAGVPQDVTDGSSGGGVSGDVSGVGGGVSGDVSGVGGGVSGDVSGVGGGVSGEATTFQVPVLNPGEYIAVFVSMFSSLCMLTQRSQLRLYAEFGNIVGYTEALL